MFIFQRGLNKEDHGWWKLHVSAFVWWTRAKITQGVSRSGEGKREPAGHEGPLLEDILVAWVMVMNTGKPVGAQNKAMFTRQEIKMGAKPLSLPNLKCILSCSHFVC